MAKVYGIRKRLEEHNIDKELAKEIIGSGDLVDVITRMEKRLEPSVTYEILDSCACAVTPKEMKKIKAIEAETLEEKINKIADMNDFHSDWNICLNPDNTITAGWIVKEKDRYACVCSAAVQNGVKVSDLSQGERAMPLTYCLCCAGHCRRHLEKLLDLQLKTKEIASSPINSGGQEPCSFIFEILAGL